MCIFHCLTTFFSKGGKSKIYLLALYELIHLNILKKSIRVNENEIQNWIYFCCCCDERDAHSKVDKREGGRNMELQIEKIQKEQPTDMLIITTE